MPEPRTIRPNQAAFILGPLVSGTIGLGAFAWLVLVLPPLFGANLFAAGFFALAGFAFLLGWSVIAQLARARKTSYTLEGDRLIYRTGGILSDQTTELQLGNVTQVELRIPFLERRVFGTGRVSVTSAGSAHARVNLTYLDEPEAFLDLLLERMRESGFSLARRQRLMDTRPSLALLVARQAGRAISGLLVGLLFVAAMLVPVAIGIAERLEVTSLQDFFTFVATGRTPEGVSSFQLRFAIFGTLATAVVVAGGLILALARDTALHFTRRYTLFDDVVEHETTFLGLHRVMFPIENLSDVTTRQGLLGRLLGIADIRLSCQGMARPIAFSALPEAGTFRETLLGILDPSSRPEGETGSPATADTLEFRPLFRRDAAAAIGQRVRRWAIPLALLGTAPLTLPRIPIEGFEADRWLIVLPLVLAIVGVLFAISLAWGITRSYLRMSAQRYEVGRTRLSATRTRVSHTEVAFTFPQITSVVVVRGIMDLIFGTATIRFRSIGSRHPLVFEHVRKGPEAAAMILDRLSLVGTTPQETVRPRTTPLLYALNEPGRVLGPVVFSIVAIAASLYWPPALLALPVILGWALVRFGLTWFAFRHARLEVHPGHLLGVRGVFRRIHHTAPLRQVKDARSHRYPFSASGSLTWFAGGGARFTLPFIEDVAAVHDRLDRILLTQPQHGTEPRGLDATPVLTAGPDVRAPLARTALLSLAVFPAGIPALVMLGFFLPALLFVAIPLLLVLPVVIVAMEWIRLKRTLYELQESRIVRERGILRRKRFTILLDRIDHLGTIQGAFHKMFGTGDLAIYTTGSASVELVLSDLRGHEGWLAPIEARLSRREPLSVRAAPPGDLVEDPALVVGQ